MIRCSNQKTENNSSYTLLHTDSLNVVKLNDTLIINEYTCRGCEYEKTMRFDIADSLDHVKLLHVITTDNNKSNTDGGSIKKDLVLIPLKAGNTSFKLFKFYGADTIHEDSLAYKTYNLEIKN